MTQRSTPSVRDLLEEWPDRRAVLEAARRVNPDLSLVAVHRWHARESIPSAYWKSLVDDAASRGVPVSLDGLAVAHSFTPSNEAAPSAEADG